MIDVLQSVIGGTALMGAFLNAQHRVEGFYLWIVANTLGVYLFATTQLYGMMMLYLVYIGICVYGIVTWRKE
jgi:nicotinamide mononucleotide transporter